MNVRTKAIQFKLSESEYQAIKKRCDSLGFLVGTYARHLILIEVSGGVEKTIPV